MIFVNYLQVDKVQDYSTIITELKYHNMLNVLCGKFCHISRNIECVYLSTKCKPHRSSKLALVNKIVGIYTFNWTESVYILYMRFRYTFILCFLVQRTTSIFLVIYDQEKSMYKLLTHMIYAFMSTFLEYLVSESEHFQYLALLSPQPYF